MRPPPVNWERASSLSLTEAAAVLECSRSKAYLLAEKGELDTTRDALGDLRVKPATLKRLLKAREGVQGRLPLRGLGR